MDITAITSGDALTVGIYVIGIGLAGAVAHYRAKIGTITTVLESISEVATEVADTTTKLSDIMQDGQISDEEICVVKSEINDLYKVLKPKSELLAKLVSTGISTLAKKK